ncbi:MAG TPA: protein kinase [Thermoanaerobaculia bacterium]|nr:protein kinase [Thermoanaerobaculia bacterium]
MESARWDALSAWLTSWLDADPAERERLRARLAAEQPDLVAEAEALAAASGESRDFLETPALVLAAQSLAQDDRLLPPGFMVGPYSVVDLLARGGMGDVYRATDVRLNRDVALKVLTQTKTGDPRRVGRFMHEARVTAALDHPNVVRVFDVGRFEDRAYLVAELLEGETLRARVERGPLPVAEVVRVALEIARGLAAAHAAGLVHRDLKPDNIFLTRSGTTKILDFGIAKLAQDETVRDGFSTLTGVVLGTTGYLSPEQIRGARIDSRADLFALGAVLYEMITGRRAFAQPNVVETLHAILHDDPQEALDQREDLPQALADAVRRLLEKSPDARFQSSSELITALEAVDLSGAPGRQRAPRRPVSPELRRPPRANWAVAALGAMVALAAGMLWSSRRAPGMTPSRAPSVTLAIMPFRSIPPTTENDLLELGLAEVLISRLGQLSTARVLPLSATERLRTEEPSEVARKLRADRILTVTLLRDKGSVRAVPRLMSASGEPVWSTTIDTDASSVFSIQDIIVTKVIEELAPDFPSGGKSRLARPGTRNSADFEAHVRGRAHVLKPTRADLARAKELFEKALELDARYADAWAGLGSAYKRMPIAAGVDPREAFPKAKEAAHRALQLEPENAEAHSVLGTAAFWYDWDYPRAERLLRRALELQPSSADSQLFLAHLLANLGRFDEALQEIRRARALDPAWPLARAHEGHFLFMAGRYEKALEHLNDAVKIDPHFWPGHTFRMLSLLALGRYDEAIRQAQRLAELRRSDRPEGVDPAYTGYASALIGRRPDAEQVLAKLRARPGGSAAGEALVLHGLERDAEALRRLEDAVDERAMAVTFLGVYPWWDDLRDHPDFRRLLSRVHLLEVSDEVRRSRHGNQSQRPAR